MPNVRLLRNYTKAIKEGLLIDVSNTALNMGAKYPVAITRAVWDKYIKPNPELKRQTESERLTDILTMLKSTKQYTRNPGNCMWFTVTLQMYKNGKRIDEEVEFKSVTMPGDAGKRTYIIMLPEEG